MEHVGACSSGCGRTRCRDARARGKILPIIEIYARRCTTVTTAWRRKHDAIIRKKRKLKEAHSVRPHCGTAMHLSIQGSLSGPAIPTLRHHRPTHQTVAISPRARLCTSGPRRLPFFREPCTTSTGAPKDRGRHPSVGVVQPAHKGESLVTSIGKSQAVLQLANSKQLLYG